MRSITLLVACCVVSGCASLSDAAQSPCVWGPLAAAAVMQVDSWDEDVSEWARDETPLFGSTSSAQDWSDGLRNAAVAGYAVSVLATPSGAGDGGWVAAKARNAAVGVGAFAVTAGTAWARVESGDHYPSDVLVGMPLGNFIGAFFAQTFLGVEPDARLALGAEPLRGGAMLHWDVRF